MGQNWLFQSKIENEKELAGAPGDSFIWPN